ncbi:MAG: ribosomal subunit interface protein [Bacteroidetes bacterium GWF2_43_63]|nr:MAG: ribosomal subunit interface protein [Bacteroidetes bacterium GWE2_42_42]OFY55173.1 MAG: ribosomal subunit interface protein [Bacteroidetes bacterium GWF2_43_63]HBG70204.1 ribosome-associated translation inhibitor RaiA [Bacteroidales bacterium]HCB63123.1 ribosome-associated translation inhibitor RaiA [Bacteroidales bacterium]HCY22658.1 ribosome-associated translation inhibitor RaiA [Bacteroidales bacterium]
MKISISSVKFKADKSLEDFIQEKITKLATNYDNLISGEVILRLDNSENQENKIAEIRLNIPGNDLFAKKQCKTFEEATDSALDAIKKQLLKHKDKIHP